MGLTIANNVSSLTAQNNLARSSSALSKSLERLSSGFKVNRGADGPAALVISEQQRAQISGLKQAISNAEKGASLVQTAEGALAEINTLLVKVRSLALDSANSAVNDDNALAANQAEIANALDTINRIANNTQFGKKVLLNGSSGISGTPSDADVTFLKATSETTAGAYTVEVTTVGERANVSAADDQENPLATAEILTINGVSISLNAGLTQDEVVSRINEFSSQTGVVADIDGTTTRLYTNAFGSDASITVVSNVAAADDSSGFGTTVVTDSGVNVIGEIEGVAFTGKGNVLTATSGAAKGLSVQLAADGTDIVSTVDGAQGNVSVSDNSLVFQIGANQNQTAKIAIGLATAQGLGVGVSGNQFANLSEIDVTSASKSQDTLGIVDAAIDEVTTLRGALGAFQQNTLESTAASLRATLENTTAAESIIRDTDFASEIANFTKQQVLVQAGTSILGSANQTPQLVLSLLNR